MYQHQHLLVTSSWNYYLLAMDPLKLKSVGHVSLLKVQSADYRPLKLKSVELLHSWNHRVQITNPGNIICWLWTFLKIQDNLLAIPIQYAGHALLKIQSAAMYHWKINNRVAMYSYSRRQRFAGHLSLELQSSVRTPSHTFQRKVFLLVLKEFCQARNKKLT